MCHESVLAQVLHLVRPPSGNSIVGKSSVIFVSGDVKPDWVHRSENVALFPRFELIDEFRRVSGGETLHLVTFSRLLELFGATAETVQQVRREEVELQIAPEE